MNNKLFGLMLLMCCGVVLARNYTLVLSEHKRLEVTISSELMNRLTVVNDRIANIFGDEGTFVTQADENTGQIFIKPTVENSNKPLSITIITENGITQDLLLKPEGTEAATVILKGTNNVKNASAPMVPQAPNGTMLSVQEQIIQAMKQGVNGALSEHIEKPQMRSGTKEYRITYVHSYKADPFNITVGRVKNLSNTKLQLKEKSFYKSADLALSLSKAEVDPKEQVLLYVLRQNV